MKTEKRLYAFAPYQLTGIQKGIQMQHALTEYTQVYGNKKDFKDWAENWKTTILLDGGTTNEGEILNKYSGVTGMGTMQEILKLLIDNDINVEGFWETDLNNTLTAFVFIADEPSFNHEDYPFFDNWIRNNITDTREKKYIKYLEYFKNFEPRTLEDYRNDWPEFEQYVEELGGYKNVFVKYLLKGKRLASN